MIYDVLREIGEKVRQTSNFNHDDIVVNMFEHLVVLRPDDKESKNENKLYLLNIVDNRIEVETRILHNQDALEHGIIITKKGSGAKLYMSGFLTNFIGVKETKGKTQVKYELEKNIDKFESITAKKINESISTYFGDSYKEVTDEDEAEFSSMITKVKSNLDNIKLCLEEIQSSIADKETQFVSLLCDGVPIGSHKMYKYFCVNNRVFDEVEASEVVCSLCGTKKLASYKFYAKLNDFAFFTSSDDNHSADFGNFQKSSAICVHCLIDLLFGNRLINSLNTNISGLKSITYPVFILPEKVEPDDYKNVLLKNRNIINMLEDIYYQDDMFDTLEDIMEGSDFNNSYTLNMLLYEISNASTKIKNHIQGINTKRLSTIFSAVKSSTKEAKAHDDKYDTNYTKSKDGMIVNPVSFYSFKGLLLGKGDKPKITPYINFINNVLTKQSYPRKFFMAKIADGLSDALYDTKDKNRTMFYRSPYKYHLMVKFLEKINIIDKGVDNLELLQKIEKEMNERDVPKDLKIVYDFLNEEKIYDSEKVALILLGYLAEKVSYYQSLKNNKGIVQSQITKHLNVRKIKSILSETNEKLYIYSSDLSKKYDGFILKHINRFYMDKQTSNLCEEEAFLCFMLGVNLKRDSISLLKTKEDK